MKTGFRLLPFVAALAFAGCSAAGSDPGPKRSAGGGALWLKACDHAAWLKADEEGMNGRPASQQDMDETRAECMKQMSALPDASADQRARCYLSSRSTADCEGCNWNAPAPTDEAPGEGPPEPPEPAFEAPPDERPSRVNSQLEPVCRHVMKLAEKELSKQGADLPPGIFDEAMNQCMSTDASSLGPEWPRIEACIMSTQSVEELQKCGSMQQ